MIDNIKESYEFVKGIPASKSSICTSSCRLLQNKVLWKDHMVDSKEEDKKTVFYTWETMQNSCNEEQLYCDSHALCTMLWASQTAEH